MQKKYDARDRLVETIYPDGSREEARYDFDNNLVGAIDADGNRSNNTYDARGRLTRRVDAIGNTQVLEYNAANELIASTDENGYRQEFTYDDLGRQTAVTDSEGTATTEYDKAGNATAQIDPLGNRTEFTYDDRDRPTRVKDALTGETLTKYDSVGNVLEVTDPEQNTTSFTYDARNRLTSETNELGDSRNFDYDFIGNLTRKSDRNNRITEWTYDALNRPQQENWLDSQSNQVNSISFAYDSIGQLIAIEDSDSSYRFTYDQKGRQTSVDNTGTPGAPNVLLEYSYDNLDNLLSVSETINGKAAGITAYNYDELNRTSQITQTGTGVADKRVDFGYDGLGQFTSIERYSDLSGSQLVGNSTYTYDGLNRLTNLSHSNGSGTFAFYDFEYDAASRITKIVDIDGTSDYSYDQTNQLTSATHTDSNKQDESYTYDENGNRTASHLHGSDYSTGLNNRLLTDGIYNYQYDAEGNMVLQVEIATGEEREFVWDHRNRLTAVIDKDSAGDALQEVDFTYDAMNRRIAKEVNADPQNSTSGVAMRFIYDRDNVLLEFVDADGIEGISAPTFHQRYLHGPGVDQMLAQENASGESLWNFTDHLGTGRDLTDDSGNVVNHLTYDSFGNVVSQTDDTVKSRYLFTGREFDEETGLSYYRARYYYGWRFISEDPIGFDGGQTNLYAYVANRPLDRGDPSGTSSMELQALLSIAQPRSSRPREWIYLYPLSADYTTAFVSATTWFYLITEPDTRADKKITSDLRWLLRGKLKNAPGKAILRPIGLQSDNRNEPTIDLQKEKKTGLYHGTVVDGVPRPASEIKFPYVDKDSYQEVNCPALRPYQEPILIDDKYPASPWPPEPSPQPTPQPAPRQQFRWEWNWPNWPIIPIPRIDPSWLLQ